MFFAWLKRRRRRKILADPFPPAWLTILHEQVRLYEILAETDQKKLRDAVQIVIAEKEWEGCRGLEMTDEIRVTVAALASVLVLGFDEFYFDNVQTILVYPDAYVVDTEQIVAGEATINEPQANLGSTMARGPVILSWEELQENLHFPGRPRNLVYHEFAHQLDMLNGAFDGTPELPGKNLRERWAKIMDREYQRLRQAARHRRRSLLDFYGATNPAEFFAVTTECFFGAPRAMRDEHAELYALFRAYFRQDPAAWDEDELLHGI